VNFLKFILINLNIGFLFNLFPSIVFMNARAEFQAPILLGLNCFFLLLLSNKKTIRFNPLSFPSTKILEFKIIHNLFFVLLTIQIFIAFFYGEVTNLLFAISLMSISYTFILLVNSIDKIHGSSFLINSYSFLCVFILMSSIFVFLLASTGLYDPHTNLVSPGSFSAFDRNFEINHEDIFNPLYLTFILDSHRGIPFFGEFGLFVGLSHEPHTSMLFVVPGIFLFLINKSKLTQILFWILSFVFALITSSVTGLITLVICYIVYIIFSKNKNFLFLKLLILFVLASFVYTQIDSILYELGLDIINYKLNSQSSTSSKGVTLSLFTYLYSPISIFGSGAFVNIGSDYVKDIGFVNFLIIISIQICYLIGIIKILKKSFIQPEYLYYFLFGLYFYIHSFKIGNLVFENVFYLLIIYILSKAHVFKKKDKALDYF